MTAPHGNTPAPAGQPARKPGPDPAAPSDRLWFHLDDVLHLAAHTAASPRHTATSAQALLVPALSWTDEYGSHALISNGLPGWYDANGRRHTARACAWIRHPAGSAPAAVRTGRRLGHLPLRSPGTDAFDLLAWLHRAADSGQHWLSLDISRTAAVLRPDCLKAHDQCGVSYPRDVVWAAATVACVPEIGGGLYPALVAKNYRTASGAEIARFDRPTADRIVADLSRARDQAGYQPGWHATLRFSGDLLEVFDEHYRNGEPRLRRYDVAGPDDDGYYLLGAFRWPWLRTDLP